MPLETCAILTDGNIKEVVKEIEHEHVIQLVTDDGLNIKKVCLKLVVGILILHGSLVWFIQ